MRGSEETSTTTSIINKLKCQHFGSPKNERLGDEGYVQEERNRIWFKNFRVRSFYGGSACGGGDGRSGLVKELIKATSVREFKRRRLTEIVVENCGKVIKN